MVKYKKISVLIIFHNEERTLRETLQNVFLMDYPNRRRLKILGTVDVVEIADNPQLVERLHDPAYRAVPERAFVITLAGFDWNCPQHIPQRYTLEELAALEQGGEI